MRNKRLWGVKSGVKGAKIVEAADFFCGAGGTTLGVIRALRKLGYQVRLSAVNHWQIACATHHANHPDQPLPFCASVDSLNPRRICGEGELDIMVASPECTHHSIARGGKPIDDQSRATAWCVVRQAEFLRPALVLMENVKEFVDWGPCVWVRNAKTGVKEWRPDPARKGELFRAWVACMEALGYTVEWRLFCAADYGVPTIRTRLIIQCQRADRKITWPNPTHSKLAVKYQGDTRLGVTQRRAGSIPAAANLKPWRAAWECIDFSLPCPSIFLSKEEAKAIGCKRPLVKASCRRIALGTEKYTMRADEPFILNLTHGGRVEAVSEPFNTVTCANRGEKAVVMPFTAAIDHQGGNGLYANDARDPLTTVTTKQRHVVVAAHVARQFGTAVGHDMREPTRTVTTGGAGGKSQVIAAFVAQANYEEVGHSANEPMSTVTCRGTNQQLVGVHLAKFYGRGPAGHDVEQPLGTVTTKDRFGVISSYLDIPPLTAERAVMARRVAAFLREHGVDVPGEFATTRAGLVIYDIGMRMFTVRELAAAQGFPPDYIFTGNKAEQVKQIGNAVPPGLAEALVLAAVSGDPEVGKWLYPEPAPAEGSNNERMAA